MHRSVLQNEDYIEFAFENTVEVMCFDKLDQGRSTGDKKGKTYTTKDKDGKTVDYLIEFPGMTVKDINDLAKSKAKSYNETGQQPFTAFVNPYTEKKLRGLSDSKSAKQVMEAVLATKEQLNEMYGPSLSRKDILKLNEAAEKVRAVLKKSGAAKALSAYKKVAKIGKKGGKRLEERALKVKAELLEAAKEELDNAEELIDEGDLAAANKILKPHKRALKKSPLEARLKELLAKANPEPEKPKK